MICIVFTKYDSVDQIEKDEMGGACSTYGGEERRIQGFGGENLRERGHLEGPGVDGRIILRLILRKWDGGGVSRTGLIRLSIGAGGGHL